MASRIDTLISKCASWDEFVLLVNNQQDNKFKGELFERLTQVFLKTSSIYASKLENVWWCNNNELPERVRKKLRLPTTDEGIDLICETVEGEFWSVQCKYKADQGKPLNHKELSTFTSLSFNTAKNIVLGLVVHTSTKKVRKSDLMANVTEVGLEKWLEISQDDWKRIRAVCRANTLSPPKKRKPRKHQKAAIKDAVNYFSKRSASRGKLIMPCGTGKSLTAFWIAQALGSKTIVVAVPSLALIRQSLGDWTAEFLAHDVRPEWIAVCSDSTVGNTGDADSTVASVYETGIPTTTDELIIQKFLKRKSKSPKIIFTTYQSGQKLCEVTKNFSLKFDLLICDEAHKTVGTSNKSFATLLFDENIRVKHRIFMTATERVYRQRKDDVVSMDDPKIYGEVFHQLSFKQAIKQKIICDYKILTIAVTASEAKALIENNEGLSVAVGKNSYETDAHNLSVGLTLQKVFEKYKIQHAITFHSSINRAQFFSNQQDLLPTRYEIKNYHVSSKFSAGERARMLQQFASDDLSLISNARCLTEGVDIPSIDCVVFADAKQSTVDIVQAAGRAMRQSKGTGKEYGYILLPLIIPEDDDLSDFGENTKFKNIVRVITSLSTQDERITEQMKDRADRKSSVPSDIVQIEADFLNLVNISSEELSETINTRIWSSVGKANWIDFEKCKEYARKSKITTIQEWQKANHPPDVPRTPHYAYKNTGWVGWSDFLGNKSRKDFLSFKEAHQIVLQMNLKTERDWRRKAAAKQIPDKIPTNPASAYDEWLGWPHWLRGAIPMKIWNFSKAKQWIIATGVKSESEWRNYKKARDIPRGMPKSPETVYAGTGWNGWSDFLGTSNVSEYLSFEQAKEFAASEGITKSTEWYELAQKKLLPNNIPNRPEYTYRDDGWSNWPEFLGKTVENFDANFHEVKKIVHALGLQSKTEFDDYTNSSKKHPKIPKAPHLKYKNEGWINWQDFLGYKKPKSRNKNFYSYDKAKKAISPLNIKSKREYLKLFELGKLDPQMPKAPEVVYKARGSWLGWPDFLGKIASPHLQ